MAGMFYEIMPGYGYCLNIDDAHNTVRVYQQQTRNRYCSTVKTPQFGNIDVNARSRKIHWEDDQRGKVTRECLLYDGVPFHILGKKVFYCEFGRNRNTKTVTDEKGNTVTKPTSTKKVDCPALIYMKEVMKYPGYMISENSPDARLQMAEKLRNDICERKAQGERRFYIVFPNIKEHQNHAVFYDGKLIRPEEIEIQDDNILQDGAMVPTKQFLPKPSNAQLCREVIDKLESVINSNSTNAAMLGQAEAMLKDALEFFNANPSISTLLTS